MLILQSMAPSPFLSLTLKVKSLMSKIGISVGTLKFSSGIDMVAVISNSKLIMPIMDITSFGQLPTLIYVWKFQIRDMRTVTLSNWGIVAMYQTADNQLWSI